jgi:hypothetical protein
MTSVVVAIAAISSAVRWRSVVVRALALSRWAPLCALVLENYILNFHMLLASRQPWLVVLSSLCARADGAVPTLQWPVGVL